MIEVLIVLALTFAVSLLVQYIERRSQRPVVARRPSSVMPRREPSTLAAVVAITIFTALGLAIPAFLVIQFVKWAWFAL